MLHRLRETPGVAIAGLLTTVNQTHDRVAMHAVRRPLLERQAAAAGLPLSTVPLPWPCPNGLYEERFGEAVAAAQIEGITHIAFGDLFLEDIRDYRIGLLEGTGIEPLFPIWCGRGGTAALAREMVDAGLRATITCLDPARMPRGLVGRTFDHDLLDALPPEVDPCAENGEFHTFATAGPMLDGRVAVSVGEVVQREGFVFADVVESE